MPESCHRHPMPGQVLMITPDGDLDGDYADTGREPSQETSDLDQATTITSKVAGTTHLHKVVLDVDLPCRLIESSTPGHYHLYIDAVMGWDRYQALLEALALAGIIEWGYASASVDRGYTRVRLPWVRKQRKPEPEVTMGDVTALQCGFSGGAS